jgi:hypothetical protein
LSEAAMTMGRKKVDHAIRIWNDCMAHNRFPGYPPEIVYPQYPGWVETQWLEREIAYEERRTRAPMLTDLAGG